MNKKVFYIIFIFIFFIILFFDFYSTSFAADPKLITTIKKAFEKIEEWIIKISTPAAAVAVRNRYFYEKV